MFQEKNLNAPWVLQNIVNIKRNQSLVVQQAMEARFGQKYNDYRYNWDNAGAVENVDNKNRSYDAPLNLDLEITSYCNLSCKMCFRHSMPPSERINMSMEMIDRIVSEASNINIPAVMIGGGAECTLHPRLKEILKKISTIPSLMDAIIITNGLKLTPDIIDVLIDLQITKLFISLDAATEKTYKKIRGASLSSVESNIQYLIKRKKELNSVFPLLRVSFVEQPDNNAEKQLFFEKWKTDAQIIDFQDLIDFGNRPIRTQEQDKYFCKDVYRRLFISSNGEFQACCGGLVVGSLEDEGILDCWNGKRRKSIHDSFACNTLLDKCKRCDMTEAIRPVKP